MELFKQAKSNLWWFDLRFRGKRIRRSTGQTTRARAMEVASNFLEQLQRGENDPSPRRSCLTLAEFALQHFLPYLTAHSKLTESSKSYYRLGWNHLSLSPLKSMRLDAIRRPHVEMLQIPGSKATHNRALKTLRRCLNIAHELDLLGKVPKFSLVEQERRTTLITAEIEQQIAKELDKSKRKNSLQVGLYIMLDCGLRPKEVAGLAIPDVSLTAGTISVARVSTKTSSGVRTVPMTDRVRQLLTQRLNGKTAGWVFPSPRYPGRHIERQALTVAWRKYAKQAGVDIDLYSARHTYGTDVMAATKDPFLTRDLMGHADIATTAIYQHPELGVVGKLMNDRNRVRKDILLVIPEGEERTSTT